MKTNSSNLYEVGMITAEESQRGLDKSTVQDVLR